MKYDRESIRDGLFEQIAAEGERLGLIRAHTDAERAESRARILNGVDPAEDVWVFGYGSLMWHPAIRFAERRQALLYGWHRSFCLWTPLGRGSPDFPGLVLGLDRGGSCHGIAYRIAAQDRDEELGVLWRREMVADGYLPRWIWLRSSEGPVRAIVWTINRNGERYAGRLPLPEVARTLATASGKLGPGRDYLEKTVQQLDEIGIADNSLHEILRLVRAMDTQEDNGR